MAETTSSPPRTSSSSTGVGSRRPPTRRPSAEPLRPLRDRASAVMTQPLSPRPLLFRWTLTVTAAEAAGFLAPAVVGAVTAGLPWYGALPALLAAGAVEGAVLGWAQAAVLRRALPALRGPRWVMLTAVAAAVAYLLGAAIALGSTGPGWAGIVVAAVCGPLLLLPIGGAQWLELRHHVARAATWIPATAVAWLLALAAFLLIATPLWHEGQPVGVSIAIGAGAGVVMAFVQAVLTGWWLLRQLSQERKPRRRQRVPNG